MFCLCCDGKCSPGVSAGGHALDPLWLRFLVVSCFPSPPPPASPPFPPVVVQNPLYLSLRLSPTLLSYWPSLSFPPPWPLSVPTRKSATSRTIHLQRPIFCPQIPLPLRQAYRRPLLKPLKQFVAWAALHPWYALHGLTYPVSASHPPIAGRLSVQQLPIGIKLDIREGAQPASCASSSVLTHCLVFTLARPVCLGCKTLRGLPRAG